MSQNQFKSKSNLGGAAPLKPNKDQSVFIVKFLGKVEHIRE